MSASPPTRRAVRVVAIFVGLGAGLGAAEIALRLVAPQASYANERFYAADPLLGWRLAPGLDVGFTNRADFRVRVRTDGRGLRVVDTPPVTPPDTPPDTPPETPTILAVGDSFVFGWGIEEADNFVERAASAAGATVANAGVPLYDVCQEADRAIALLAPLRPRVVVLGIFLGNDESDALTDRHGFDVEGGALVPRGPVSTGTRLRRALWQPILDRSHLLRLVRGSAPVAWLQRHLFGVTSFARWVALQRLTVFRTPASPEIVEGSRRLAGCVERLRDASAAAGATLVAVLIPDQLELEPERLAATAEALGEARDAVDAAAPRRRIAPALAALGVPIVDPLAELAKAQGGATLYFRQDPHMTAAGHAAMARALAPVLGELLSAGRSEAAGSPAEPPR